MDESFLKYLKDELRIIFERFVSAAADEEVKTAMLAEIGWVIDSLSSETKTQLQQNLEQIANSYDALEKSTNVVELFNQIKEVLNNINLLSEGIIISSSGDQSFNSQFSQLGSDLLKEAYIDFIDFRASFLYRLLLFVEALQDTPDILQQPVVLDSENKVVRLPYAEPIYEFNNFLNFLYNPVEALERIYFQSDQLQDNESTAETAKKFFYRLSLLLETFGLSIQFNPKKKVSYFEFGESGQGEASSQISFYFSPIESEEGIGFRISLAGADQGNHGLIILPNGKLDFEEAYKNVRVKFDLSGLPSGVSINGDGISLLKPQSDQLAASIEIETFDNLGKPFALLGDLSGSHIALDAISAAIAINQDTNFRAQYKVAIQNLVFSLDQFAQITWEKVQFSYGSRAEIAFKHFSIIPHDLPDIMLDADLTLGFNNGTFSSGNSTIKLYRPSQSDIIPLNNFHLDDKCVAFQWPDSNLNKYLGSLVSGLFDESKSVQNDLYFQAIFGHPIKEMRLDWTTKGVPRTINLPGLIKIKSPDNGRFSMFLGGENKALTQIGLGLTFKKDSMVTIATNFAWQRDNERELHNDADESNSESKPFISIFLTAKNDVSLILTTFDITNPRPRFLKQTKELIPEILPNTINQNHTCKPIGDFVSFDPNSWGFDYELNTSQLPFLKEKESNQFIEICEPESNSFELSDNHVKIPLCVKINVGDLVFETEFAALFNWDTLDIQVSHNQGIVLSSPKEVLNQNFLGMSWDFKGKPVKDENGNVTYEHFILGTDRHNYFIAQADGAELELGFDGLGDTKLKFRTTDFRLSPAGISLTTNIVEEPVKLNGIDTKFTFGGSGLKIVNSKIVGFTIAGSGPLPPDLVGEAMADILLEFGTNRNGDLTLKTGKAELQTNKPLECKGTRFQFSVEHLGIQFVKDGKFHLYFTLTGAARFVLAQGDDVDGALALLPNIEIKMIECPLTGDASVLAKHIEFLIELPKPVSFDFLGCFELELRAIGFVPQAEMFDGDGAMQLTGQVKFAQGPGDVADSRHDYHRLFIGLPKKGSFIPRLHFEQIAINLNFGEAFRLSGVVDFRDSAQEKGFLGEGLIQIKGLPTLAAAFGFLRVRRTPTSPWLRAWFIYIEGRGFSFMIPIIQIYIREIGLGFGYRFTLVSIKEADRQDDIRKLLAELKKLSRTQGELSKRDRWEVDIEPRGNSPRWTIVFRAMISQTSASPSPLHYSDAAEKSIACLFLFDAVIAFRSDLTFFMAVRGWLNANYSDYFNDVEGIRNKPLFSGFVLLSPRQKRFLAHVASNPDGIMGNHPPLPGFVKSALENAQFSATLLIEPGLLHYELGWPNMLRWKGKIGPLEVEIRGGFIFRISTSELVMGTSLFARGSLKIDAGFSAGIVGVSISAFAEVAYGARYIGVLDFKNVAAGSAFYAAIGLELYVELAIKFWIKLLFAKKTFRFSVGIGFTAGLDYGFLGDALPGIRGQGTISLKAMGRSLRFGVKIALNEDGVKEARRRTERFMQIGLESTEVDRLPGIDPKPEARKSFASTPEGAARFLMRGDSFSEEIEARMSSDLLSGNEDDTDLDFKVPNYSVYIVPTPKQDNDEDSTPVYCFSIYPQGERKTSGFVVAEQGFLPVPPENDTDDLIDFTLTFPAKSENANYQIEHYNPSTHSWEPILLSVDSETQYSWKANWNQPIIFGENVHDSNQEEVLTLKDYLIYAYIQDEDDIPLKDPSFNQETVPLEDDRVLNPTEAAFEAAVRGAVTQFEGSPFFKRDDTQKYDVALGQAFENNTSIYSANGMLDENTTPEERQRAEQSEQADQHRGIIIQDIIADTKESISDQIKIEESLAFQMGLVFRVRGDEKPAWLSQVVADDEKPQIRQRNGRQEKEPSDLVRYLNTFNIDLSNFGTNPPQFERIRHYTDANTIAIRWDLIWPESLGSDCTPCQDDPEHHLLHYHVVRRALDSQDRDHVFTVNPVDVVHKEAGGTLQALRPRFQIVDHFSYETEEEQINIPASGKSYLYTITPIDFADNKGRPLTIVATRYPNQPPQVPVDGQLIVAYTLDESETVPSEEPVSTTPEIILPDIVYAQWSQPVPPKNLPNVTIQDYRLVFRKERTLPIGSYGLDASSQRPKVKILPSSFSTPRPTDIIVSLEQPTNVDGQLRVEVPIDELRNVGIIPTSEWQSESWQVFFQTVSVNGVPSALAPVQLMLRVVSSDPEVTGSEERLPAELEWISKPIKMPLIPPKDQRAQVAPAHFPMPQGNDLVFNLSEQAESTVSDVSYQPHPFGIRTVRIRWNQGPSDLVEYPFSLHAGYKLLELDIDSNTTDTFDDAQRLNDALRQIQDVQMLSADDSWLTPGDTLSPNLWEAWYPSSITRIKAAQDNAIEGSKNPYSPWYSWRDSMLVWPKWEGLTDENIPARNGLLHPLLQELVDLIEVGKSPDPEDLTYKVDIQASPPMQPVDLAGFLQSTAPQADPYGWGVLQRFGLSVAFTIHDQKTGEFIVGENLVQLLRDMLSHWKNNVRDSGFKDAVEHLHIELLIKPSNRVELEKDSAFGANGLLGLVQISLRPRIIQYAEYRKLTFRGKPNQKITVQFALSNPISVINQTDSTFGQMELVDVETVIKIPLTFSIDGEAHILTRSDALTPLEWRKTVTTDENHPTDKNVFGVLIKFNQEKSLENLKDPDKVFLSKFFEPAPSISEPSILKQQLTLNDNDRKKMEELLGESNKWVVDLVVQPPVILDVTSPESAYFQIPETLPHDFAGDNNDKKITYQEKLHDEWVVLKKYIEVLNSTEDNVPNAKLPTAFADIQEIFTGMLSWTKRFFDHGANIVPKGISAINEASTLENPWLATAYPRAATPAYSTPDENGRLQYDHLISDKWAHTYRYYVRPYSRYELLWQSIQNSDDLFPERGNEDEIFTVIPDPDGGGLDVVLDRISPVEQPLILRSGRLDTPESLGQSAVPDKTWEVIVAQHGEQQLMERNQTVARRLSYRQIAFTILRRFAYLDYTQWLPNTPDVTYIEQQPAPFADTLPLQPDHLQFDENGNLANQSDVYSLDLPSRIDKFQQGALVLQWKALPFYYEHRLLLVAQTAANHSPHNEVIQKDFEYRSPIPPQFTLFGKVEGDKRFRVAQIELRRLWDSLPESAQSQWPMEEPGKSSIQLSEFVPGAIPDLATVYQLIERSYGNFEVQAELFPELTLKDGEAINGRHPYQVRQLGKQFSAELIGNLMPPDDQLGFYQQQVKLIQHLELPLSQSYPLGNLRNRGYRFDNKPERDHILLFEGVISSQDLNDLKKRINIEEDQSLLDQEFDSWFSEVRVTGITQAIRDAYIGIVNANEVPLPKLMRDTENLNIVFPPITDCHLVWSGVMDEAQADILLELTGDASFTNAVARVVNLSQAHTSENDISFAVAERGPEQPLSGSYGDIHYADFVWSGLKGFASLNLNIQDNVLVSMEWHGTLLEQQRENFKLALEEWATLPELATAVQTLLATLSDIPDSIEQVLKRRPDGFSNIKNLEYQDGELVWKEGMPKEDEQQVLTALDGDVDFLRAKGALLTLLSRSESLSGSGAPNEATLGLPAESPLMNKLVFELGELQVQEGMEFTFSWKGAVPNENQQKLLDDPNFVNYRELAQAIQELGQNILVPVTVVINPDKALPPNVAIPDELDGHLIVQSKDISAEHDFTLTWIEGFPTNAQWQAFGSLIDTSPDWLENTLNELNTLLTQRRAVPLPALNRPAQVPQALQNKLSMTNEKMIWSGRIANEEEFESLNKLASDGFDDPFTEAIVNILNAFHKELEIFLYIPVRPTQDMLPDQIKEQLMISYGAVRYHGIMTPSEQNAFKSLFTRVVDLKAIVRLVSMSLGKGMQGKTLEIRTRRVNAVPSDLKQVLPPQG